MGQIVRRKKKGRPSKADLARRAVVRRGHPEVTTKARYSGGERWWIPASGFSDHHDLLGNQSDGGGRWWWRMVQVLAQRHVAELPCAIV
uniref:Uncharacterized protein n=1 Tax=Fagus sylvatica TaxID=28930 RepID=A0A2N9FV16_FAGSY